MAAHVFLDAIVCLLVFVFVVVAISHRREDIVVLVSHLHTHTQTHRLTLTYAHTHRYGLGMATGSLWVVNAALVSASFGNGNWVSVNFSLCSGAALAGGKGGGWKKAADRIVANAVALIFVLIVLDLGGVVGVALRLSPMLSPASLLARRRLLLTAQHTAKHLCYPHPTPHTAAVARACVRREEEEEEGGRRREAAASLGEGAGRGVAPVPPLSSRRLRNTGVPCRLRYTPDGGGAP